MKSRLTILSEDEVEAIHGSSLHILEKVGILVRSPRAITLLKDAGATFDPERKTVKVPSSLVEECLRKHPTSFVLKGRTAEHDLFIEPGKLYAHPCGGCFNILDYNSGQTRVATTNDVAVLTKLIDACDNIQQCDMLDYAGDVPEQVRDIHTIAAMLRNTTKHCGIMAYANRNLQFIIRLVAAIVGGEEELRKKPIVSFGASPTSPLELSEDVSEQLFTAARHALPTSILPCPLAGGTSPVTLAGTLLQQNVEFLICHVIVQLVNPGNPMVYCARPMCMDMRTGMAAGEVEYGLMSVAAVQLAARYKMPSDVYGLSSDSKVLDEQTGSEKAMIGLLPALAGANFISGAGNLEMGVTANQEQLVIDNEMLGTIFRAVRGIEVNPDTLAIDLIEKTGPGGHFLSTEHTRSHYLSEHHIAPLYDRRVRMDWERSGKKDMVQRAHEKCTELLRDHSVQPLNPVVEKEFHRILADADRGSA